ncbi:MAG TPA: aminoacyl--tRNA ligase-related protein [Candidatus Saccharimonadia bacterium]|nr:aminoacyl--tRNA ligase-related protein [Candidatus Saccharimonadia bacterium]
MSNNYLVIKQSGEVVSASAYLESGHGSEDFKLLVKREALNIGVNRGAQGKPKYLSVANKFGFGWEPNADIGIARYDVKASLMHRLVEDYARQLVRQVGLPLYEVNGSNIFNMDHPVVSAYAQLYGDRLYQFKSGSSQVVMSYDASYPQFNLAKQHALSHKNVPFAHFSISDCYRHEQSGECMLLYRQRRFFMPDLHPYMKDVAEAFKWYPKLQKQIVCGARELGRSYEMIIEVASPALWDQYRAEILRVAVSFGRDVLVGIHHDNVDRYWIINVDYKIMDALGQSREIACIQIDVGNAPRLGIEYVDEAGHSQNPVIIHSAIPGGIERYLYMALDNFDNGLPLWLHPVQVRLVPVSDQYIDLCRQLAARNAHLPVRIEIDDRNESVGKKVRQARADLVPCAVVIGEKEALAGAPELERVVNQICQASENRPFIPLDWPINLSRQIR